MALPQIVEKEILNFIELTKTHKIKWTMNPPGNTTAYKWERDVNGKKYNVVIQGQNINHPNPNVEFYFLSIIKIVPAPQEVVLQINSQLEAGSKISLKNLFLEAQKSGEDSVFNILTDLTKGL